VAPKNPIGRLADSAISSIKDPLGTAGKVVEQAKGTAALGKMVAEQVGKSAISKATGTAGAVVGRASGRKPSADKGDIADATTEGASLRSVPDVNEPAHTTKPSAERAAESTKQHGDPMRKPARTAAKKAPAQKTAAKKAPAERPAAKTPVPSPKDVAEVVEAAVAEDPTKTAAQPVKKSTAKKTAPGDKLPTKKSASTQQPGVKKEAGKTVAGKKVAGKKAAPKTAEQVATAQGDAVTTPVGTPGAGKGRNPDTAERDLNQPGTEGIVDEATVKAVASEAKTMRKAAERNPE
jgi:hypothetical protein